MRDFDDDNDPVTVISNIDSHAKVGYAIVPHHFEEPGVYLVKVEREISNGTAKTHVYVQPFSQYFSII